VRVELGHEVRPGGLVQLEPRELEIALRRAASQLKQTEAQLGIDGVRIKEPPPDEQIAVVRTAWRIGMTQGHSLRAPDVDEARSSSLRLTSTRSRPGSRLRRQHTRRLSRRSRA